MATGADGDTAVIAADDKKALDRPGRARPGRRGRLVGRQDRACAHQKGRAALIRSALDRRRPGVRAERLSPRHRALQRRHAVVSQCARPRRKRSNGRARISASRSARTANSWSPPCRSRRCTAGASPTPSTCACRAIRRACARSAGPRTADFLATSGSEQLILWPFDGKDGPMGKQPRLAPAQARVAVVACHPRQPVVAAGYADGMVLLVRLDDGARVLVRQGRWRAGYGARLGRTRDQLPSAPRTAKAGRAAFINCGGIARAGSAARPRSLRNCEIRIDAGLAPILSIVSQINAHPPPAARVCLPASPSPLRA